MGRSHVASWRGSAPCDSTPSRSSSCLPKRRRAWSPSRRARRPEAAIQGGNLAR